MLPPARRGVSPAALLAVLASVAFAAPALAGPDAEVGAADARAWLKRIQAAGDGGNYQGTLVVSVGGTISSSRVGHYTVGDQTYEFLEALDGRQQRIVRHNDAVHTLWQETHVAIVEKRQTLAAWSTTPQDVDPRALEQYELRREGRQRVAGREAAVFVLEPRDLLRYAQRLWSDLATGLMLRADVLAQALAGGQRPVLESAAFSEVAIGVKPQPDLVLRSMVDGKDGRKGESWRIVRPPQQPTTLDAEGWTLARPVPGFRLAGCVRRGMANAGDDEPVLQAVFTDGLTHVSLFVDSYKPERHRSEMQAGHGATSTLMTRRGDWWVTTVGDVPPATLRLFADALERRRP